MLGILVLGLMVFMIFTLVRNALIGIQLSPHDAFSGTIELLVPISEHSEFYLEPWLQSLSSFKQIHGQLRIHILVDGHNPSLPAWQELHQRLPFATIHSFPMRPENAYPVPWMIRQIAASIKGQVVIIGDPELVPSEPAFLSLSKIVTDRQKPVFVVPQTAQISLLGESISVLNPTLALASVFGFKKYKRNLSHPLMSIAQGWIGMELKTFQALDYGNLTLPSWKQTFALQWDRDNLPYTLAFGEKHLLRYYPEDLTIHINHMKKYWDELWTMGNRTGLWLFAVVLFIWSFPVLFFFAYPLWAVVMVGLMIVYRFFSKVVFQESWSSIVLHPFGCLVWVGTFFWWLVSGLRERYGAQGRVRL